MTQDRIIWCVLCGARFPAAEVEGKSCCPKCGDAGVPCSGDEDLRVVVNWHELRILGIWAENWARQMDEKNGNRKGSKCIMAITRRLQRQFPKLSPLTLSQELFELPQKMREEGMQFGGIESTVPKPDIIPVNGQGAIAPEEGKHA